MPDTTHPHRQRSTHRSEVLTITEDQPCRIVNVPPMSEPAPDSRRCSGPLPAEAGEELLRKEVIQPHLPVRLPCYDFVPIAGPTFDSSLPYGLGHRLRVLPTFVT